MPTPLSSYPRPRVDTGVGLHDTPNAYNIPYGNHLPALRAWADAMRTHGLSWYKVLAADEGKVQMARVLVEHDITPVVRLYKPRPHPHTFPDPNHVQQYVAAGVRYFEWGNEPNIGGDEWANGQFPAKSDYGRLIADQWMRCAGIIKQHGGIPLFVAHTPGGFHDHRIAYRQILDHLKARGWLGVFENCAIAIHPRPHTVPPHVPPSNTLTVAFREYEWIAELFRSYLGWIPPMIATEHGYGGKETAATGYPPITDPAVWAEYNAELFRMFNPAHPHAVPPYFFGACYWLETEGGVWQQDEAFNQPFPHEPHAWGSKLLGMNINWQRTIAPPQEPPMAVDYPGTSLAVWSPFHDRRPATIDAIVLHATAGTNPTLESTLNWFLNPTAQVSAHYVIARDGKVGQAVREERASWHAGESSFNGRTNFNAFSIGIELVNRNNGEPYEAAQLSSLVSLLRYLAGKYNIKREWVVTHAQIAVPAGRKTDPRGLDMKSLLDAVYQVPAPVPPPPPPRWTKEDAATATWYVEQLARARRGDAGAAAVLIAALHEPASVGQHNVLEELVFPVLYEARK